MICDTPSVDEVLDGQVYLSNLSAARCEGTKKDLGITHVLSVCPDYPSTGPNHLCIPVDDSEYADLLYHLAGACRFIEEALKEGGRVLIHCVMGISRSTTVLAAYLMKTRSLSTSAATSFIRARRPCVQPNYGFLKQLETFEQCGYAPAATHPAYISWKRRQKQDVTNFLNRLFDTAPIVPRALFLSSVFPSEPDQAEVILAEFEITHVLSVSPAEAPTLPPYVRHLHLDVCHGEADPVLLALPEACAFLRDAFASGGRILVHSLLESRACTVVGAYLMSTRKICPTEATEVIRSALPLFDPTPNCNFTRHLKSFQACKYDPKHPSNSTSSSGHARAQPPLAAPPDLLSMTRTAASVMSDTGLDVGAFGAALAAIHQKAAQGLVPPRAPPTAAAISA
ncbi:protein-tyrosine phosphatase-like protein [Roridomyces roridus]|uniref:protein-tyrosine-phosphatase n=1 Tax=Roridomyces roridus TaxID=1738132 RepID=A0AAD7B709_9AGAR|nr:protein-tyrosine phosphatase-like protein [Roridomyces roridus]